MYKRYGGESGMECPFKRNTVKKYEYDWGRMQDIRHIKKETIITTFGECTTACAFFDFSTEGCKFKGNYPNIGVNNI